MNPIALALAVSFLDARQRRREWQAPWTQEQLSDIYYRFYWHAAPLTRGWFV